MFRPRAWLFGLWMIACDGCAPTEPTAPRVLCPEDAETSPRCLQKLARIHPTPEVCAAISARHGQARDECWLEIAQVLEDPALCARIEQPQQASLCGLAVAKRTQEAALCTSIEHARTRDRCYEQLAHLDDDSALCAKIGAGTLRTACLERREAERRGEAR